MQYIPSNARKVFARLSSHSPALVNNNNVYANIYKKQRDATWQYVY